MHLWADQERDPNALQTHFVAGGVLRVLAVRMPAEQDVPG